MSKRLFPFFVGITVLLFVSMHSYGQNLEPKGQFLADSIKIGKPIPYALSIRYPKDIDIIFPDTLYDFSPFEISRKVYFPTVSDSTHSYDSTVYYINTFEIDSTQYLSLPVFLLGEADSTAYMTLKDSVALIHTVTEVPDSIAIEALALRENTIYRHVSRQVNYILIALGIVAALFWLFIFYLLFGKRIRQSIRLKRMRKGYLAFIGRVNPLVSDLDSQNKDLSKVSEVIMLEWKKYMETVERIPYTRLTTKEISTFTSGRELVDALKVVDRAIYSNVERKEAASGVTKLMDYSQEVYLKKREEVRSGG
ncbi:MAG: hypothetical protein AAFX87_04350 [Bacteroidota bacterium]